MIDVFASHPFAIVVMLAEDESPEVAHLGSARIVAPDFVVVHEAPTGLEECCGTVAILPLARVAKIEVYVTAEQLRAAAVEKDIGPAADPTLVYSPEVG